jgi:hypothetical protein
MLATCSSPCLLHTSIEVEPGSSDSIADSCVGTVVEKAETGVDTGLFWDA